MGITSYTFVLAFLPVTLLGWTCLNKKEKYRAADAFLASASLVFIGSYDYRFVFMVLTAVCINYWSARYMGMIKEMGWRKAVMAFLVLVNLGMLVFLKYCNWFRTLYDSDAVLWKLLVPIGISFYTLEQICFIVDTCKSGSMKYSFREYVLFSAYFPVIVSGPILRHDDFIMQLREKGCRSVSAEKVAEGLTGFCLGMGKKVIIASWLGKIAALGFDDVESAKSLTMILSVLAYTLQLYFDFSGYCDIVEGISSMFGFSLPMNFNSPYKAVSIGDFWKRWHMTLTGFLTKYVYIPLGGSRKGKIRQYANIFIVFLVSGFWHGASLTYVLWGIMHGICMVADKIIGKAWLKLPKAVGKAATFIMVALMWVPFRAESIYDTYMIYWTMVFSDRSVVGDFGKHTFAMVAYICEQYMGIARDLIVGTQNIVTVMIMLVLLVVVFRGKNVMEIKKESDKKIGMAVLCGIILFVSVLQFQGVGTFIYEGF